MALLEIRDMDTEAEYFVGTCSHVGESEEIDASSRRRLAWLHRLHAAGLRIKVATLDGYQVGFLYLMPIGVCPWGPIGQDIMVIPCLWVLEEARRLGVGTRLLAEAEQETRRQGRKGLATLAYYHDFWFMPAPFFEKCGFCLAKRRGSAAILWKPFASGIEEPYFPERNYHFNPRFGKVVVDLFWNTFCLTSDMEAQRVREVAAEFGDSVLLNEYCADDRTTFCRYQIPRAIFVNGRGIGWGYAAPKDGIRAAISHALRNP